MNSVHSNPNMQGNVLLIVELNQFGRYHLVCIALSEYMVTNGVHITLTNICILYCTTKTDFIGFT